MINKLSSAMDAVADIKDGARIMIGGFLGTGTPEILMDALIEKGVKHLTVIANDGGLPAKEGSTARGIGKLIEKGMVDHIIASHIGMNPLIEKAVNANTMTYTLVPQGSFVEKIRAGGSGLGGVLTPTGVGTLTAEGKEIIIIDGKEYLLEKPLKAEFSLIRSSICDKYGNFHCSFTTKNFNYVMAMAADTVILASESIVEIGEKHPETFAMSGIFVDYIVGGEKPWQI